MNDKDIEGVDDSQSPGHEFAVNYHSMHDLCDRLLAIDYSKEFVRQYKCPPISRYYFCRQTNSGQQFYTFCALSVYLLSKLSANVAINVDDFDDPNVTIAAIIDAAKEFVDISVYGNSVNKLRLGFGKEAIDLLNDLIKKVIENANNNSNDFKKIVVKGCDDMSDENINEDLTADEINATVLEDDDYDYNIIDERHESVEEEDVKTGSDDNRIMKSECDLNEWNIEVERVLPQLKVKVHTKNMDNEWRIHYKSISVNYTKMKTLCEQTFTAIQTLLAELRSNEEKINSREKYLKQQLEHIIEEWISIKGQVSRMGAEYSSVSSGVVTKSSQLAEVSQLIDNMKQEMELYGNKMTDSSPLTVAKKAKESIKQELNAIELRIGVAVQTLILNHKN